MRKINKKYVDKGYEFERIDGRLFVIVEVKDNFKGTLVIGRYTSNGSYGSYYRHEKFDYEFTPTRRWIDTDVYFTESNGKGYKEKVEHILADKPLIREYKTPNVQKMVDNGELKRIKSVNTMSMSDNEFINHVQETFDNNDKAMKEYLKGKDKPSCKVFHMDQYEHLKDKSNKSKGWLRNIIRK